MPGLPSEVPPWAIATANASSMTLLSTAKKATIWPFCQTAVALRRRAYLLEKAALAQGWIASQPNNFVFTKLKLTEALLYTERSHKWIVKGEGTIKVADANEHM